MPQILGPRNPIAPSKVLTNSRTACLLTCPYRHYLRYELALRPDSEALALKFGRLWHKAQEHIAAGANVKEAYETATAGAIDIEEIDLAKLVGMLHGYSQCYRNTLAVKQTEIPFCFAIRRGRGAMWVMGVIDGLTDDPCWVIERKTTASDISEQSDYWVRLRGDRQVQVYTMGARSLGYDPNNIIYDVARKPAIRLKQNETVEMYTDRLMSDTVERPEFYFARREIPIIEGDLQRVYNELEQTADDIIHRRRRGIWQRNVTERTCPTCEFKGPCLSGMTVDPGNPPAGFTIGVPFPELIEAGVTLADENEDT